MRIFRNLRLSGAALLLATIATACGSAPAAAPPSAKPASSAPAAAQSAPPAAASSGAPAASKPAAGSASASAAAKPDAQAGWDQVLAAAKQEGKVMVVTAPGDSYRQVFDAFKQKYGINVETMVGGGSADLVPKVNAERQAGQYLQDVIVHSPINMHSGFKQINSLQPLRPALLLPEVLDDSKWIGGFDAGWADKDKSLVYTFVGTLSPTVFVNRDTIPESQLNSIDQLWDPKWKGQIAMDDPRLPSVGALVAATLSIVKGEDKLRTFYRQQQPALTQDRRQLAEWVIRSRYPIALGVQLPNLQDFVNQGLKIDQVKPLTGDDQALLALSAGTGAISWFDKSPHPNAAKVLINWLLSQEGQALWSKETAYNVRRTDVQPVNAAYVLDPKKTYPNTQTEEGFPVYGKTIGVSKEEMK